MSNWGHAMNHGRKLPLNQIRITPLMAYEMMGECLKILRKNKRLKVKKDYPAEFYIKRLKALGYPDIHPVTLNRLSRKVFGECWRVVKQDVLRGDYRRRCKPVEMK